MAQPLEGKVIVVTGGAGFLGRVFCKAICNAGGTVIVAEKNENAGKKLAKELQDQYEKRAVYQPVDVTSDSSIRTLIESVHGEFGYIDSLVNNAYPRNKNFGKPFEEVTYHDFVENVGMHMGGYFLTSKHFLNYFSERRQGNIINMASVYGIIAPRFEIYDTSAMSIPVEYAVLKAGIIQLTKYITRYYKGRNIRCNAISPGGIRHDQSDSFAERYNSFANNKGLLEPGDVSGTMIFLLSDASAYINGQNIVVDDGWSL
jgi:NAD(P)-dependent dehydrogenase (short-subunit alcohol dehydrogenase family)